MNREAYIKKYMAKYGVIISRETLKLLVKENMLNHADKYLLKNEQHSVAHGY